MSKLQFSTRITFRNDRGDFLVERLCEGVVTDRYTTCDLSETRRSHKNEKWHQDIVEHASTPKGSVVIKVPEFEPPDLRTKEQVLMDQIAGLQAQIAARREGDD
jgi:hypothetical protein